MSTYTLEVRVPAQEVSDKLNSLGVSGKVLNDKYTLTPVPGSRNPQCSAD